MRIKFKGGAGSGNFGHAGRPGEVGGSSSGGVGGSADSLAIEVYTEFVSTWFSPMPTDDMLYAAINTVRTSKFRGDKLVDELTASGLSDGAALELIKLVKNAIKARESSPRSSEEAGIDRILHIRDSSGKTTARKW